MSATTLVDFDVKRQTMIFLLEKEIPKPYKDKSYNEQQPKT